MADEFVCPECAFTSEKEEACPFCSIKLVRFDDGLDDYAYAEDGFGQDGVGTADDEFEAGPEELANAA